MADDPPSLSVAASNDGAEVAKGALDELRWPTRELMANLLRVMRGAGKSYDLADQVIALARAIIDAGQHTNAWYIGEEIAAVLSEALPTTRYDAEIEDAERTIACGSLQMLASNLLTQRAQIAAGSREMHEGIEQLQRAWKREREMVRVEMSFQRAKPAVAARRRAKPKVAKPKVELEPAARRAEPVVEQSRPSSTAEFMRQRRHETEKPE